MVRTSSLICLIFLFCSTAFAADVFKMRYNPQTGRGDWVNDLANSGVCYTNSDPPAFEYRVDYIGCDAIYEGWTSWTGDAANQAALIWRIAKNEFSDGSITHTEFAGEGEFQYAWASRTSYFASGVPQFLMTDDSHYLLIDGSGHKLRIQ